MKPPRAVELLCRDVAAGDDISIVDTLRFAKELHRQLGFWIDDLEEDRRLVEERAERAERLEFIRSIRGEPDPGTE